MVSLLSLVLNSLMKQEGKQFKQPCKWQTIGTECDIGMECSLRYGVCLRKEGEACVNNSDCAEDECNRQNRCD